MERVFELYDKWAKMLRDPNFRWQLVTENIYAKELNRIHPLKQRQVEAICSLAKQNPIVKKITIFGSSTSYKCNCCSDLDLCIEWSKCIYINECGDWDSEATLVYKAIKDICRDTNGCDILFLEEVVNKPIGLRIEKEGVIVYE